MRRLRCRNTCLISQAAVSLASSIRRHGIKNPIWSNTLYLAECPMTSPRQTTCVIPEEDTSMGFLEMLTFYYDNAHRDKWLLNGAAVWCSGKVLWEHVFCSAFQICFTMASFRVKLSQSGISSLSRWQRDDDVIYKRLPRRIMQLTYTVFKSDSFK